MNIILIITVLVFISIVLFILVVFSYYRQHAEQHKLMDKIKDAGSKKMPEGTTGSISFSGTIPVKQDHVRLKKPFMKIITTFGNISKPKREEDLSNAQKALLNAGYRNKNAMVIFFGAKILCAIFFLAIGLIFLRFIINKPINPLYFVSLLILFVLAGSYFPKIWLRNKIAKRKEKILEGFPDTLDLLVVCVESGMGLDAAIDRVSQEMKLANDVISEEFKLYAVEMRAGKSRRDALRNLARRCGLDEVNNLVTLLIQTDMFGTSVAQALKVHSDFMRTQRYQMAEEKAAKIPAKLVIPLVLCIFPSLFIVILGPAAIQFFRLVINR
ncbi:MAG: type II secretion system F family protein [Candidatus Scalinduaceae bacterium]